MSSPEGNRPIDSEMHEHAASIAAVVPPTAALRQSIFEMFRTGTVQPQPHEAQALIDTHIGSIARFTGKVMPSALVARFVKDRCSADVQTVPMHHSLLLPAWTEDKSVRFSDTRARTGALKFTEEEIFWYLDWIQEYPDVMLGIQYAQHLLQDFIETVTRNLPADAAGHAESFHIFRNHWAQSVNFQQFLSIALSFVSRTRGGASPKAGVSQEDIVGAFDFLDAIDAFFIRIKPLAAQQSRGVPPITFRCPMKGSLEDILVNHGALHSVLTRTVALRGTAPTRDIIQQAKALKALIRLGGAAAYQMFHEASITSSFV